MKLRTFFKAMRDPENPVGRYNRLLRGRGLRAWLPVLLIVGNAVIVLAMMPGYTRTEWSSLYFIMALGAEAFIVPQLLVLFLAYRRLSAVNLEEFDQTLFPRDEYAAAAVAAPLRMMFVFLAPWVLVYGGLVLVDPHFSNDPQEFLYIPTILGSVLLLWGIGMAIAVRHWYANPRSILRPFFLVPLELFTVLYFGFFAMAAIVEFTQFDKIPGGVYFVGNISLVVGLLVLWAKCRSAARGCGARLFAPIDRAALMAAHWFPNEKEGDPATRRAALAAMVRPRVKYFIALVTPVAALALVLIAGHLLVTHILIPRPPTVQPGAPSWDIVEAAARNVRIARNLFSMYSLAGAVCYCTALYMLTLYYSGGRRLPVISGAILHTGLRYSFAPSLLLIGYGITCASFLSAHSWTLYASTFAFVALGWMVLATIVLFILSAKRIWFTATFWAVLGLVIHFFPLLIMGGYETGDILFYELKGIDQGLLALIALLVFWTPLFGWPWAAQRLHRRRLAGVPPATLVENGLSN